MAYVRAVLRNLRIVAIILVMCFLLVPFVFYLAATIGDVTDWYRIENYISHNDH
jgi:hypothetical protein